MNDVKEHLQEPYDGKDEEIAGIRFVDYKDESQLEHVMSLVGRDLSEPYSSEFFLLLLLLFHCCASCCLCFTD